MMESKRQKQTAEIIRRHFGQVLQQEGIYIFGDAFVTVTKVMISPDISMAKIYLSVYNVDNKQLVVDKVSQHTNQLKKNLGIRVRKHIRRIPELYFYLDDTLDEIYKVNKLLDSTLKKDEEVRNKDK